jgi:5-oxoprolinase (ATP-hydrolysing)
MTNTRITDSEILERRYPVLLHRFSLRPNSGGTGHFPGGCGVIRDIEFRIPVQVSILSERRVYSPYGMEGGGDGARGRNLWIRKVWVEGQGWVERVLSLGGKNSAAMGRGERIIVETPGGGGWGVPVPGEERAVGEEVRDPKLAWKGGSLASRAFTQETN